jgi:predicted transcriptional regulator
VRRNIWVLRKIEQEHHKIKKRGRISQAAPAGRSTHEPAIVQVVQGDKKKAKDIVAAKACSMKHEI